MYWRSCLASRRHQYGDDQTQKLWPKSSKFFHRWLRQDRAWVVASWWYHSERVSARVALHILHSNFYDMYSSSGMGAVSVEYWPCCNQSRFITCLTCVVDWPGSTRPLSYTILFIKMQRMSVRDLDKMKPFHEKKERGFQIHSFERNDDNLSQTGRSQTCRQTCSWCPATSQERGLHALSSFSSKTPVTCAMQFEWLTLISWLNPSSSPFISPFVFRDKIKAQAQHDANRFCLWIGW